MRQPPAPGTYPVVVCPSCAHGIDPHGTDPGDRCGVGDADGLPCCCMWSPNDIASHLMDAVTSYLMDTFVNEG